MMLIGAAAQRWSVDPSTCRAENGVVTHEPTGRKLPYGKLVDAAAKLPVPENVALKAPADFKLIGTPQRRLDSAGKVDGSAKFGIDSRPAGMKFAVVAAAPTFGGKLIAVDEAKAKAVPGVTQVVRLDDAVAIVALHTWAAKQGLAALGGGGHLPGQVPRLVGAAAHRVDAALHRRDEGRRLPGEARQHVAAHRHR